MNSSKAIGVVLAGGMAALAHTPTLLHKLSLVALFFLSLDTVTGYICGAFDRNWSSHLMRVKMIAKMAQYALLMGICTGASWLSGAWYFVEFGWASIIAIEAHSNIENLIRWQAFGVNLGPANVLLEKLSQFFAASQLDQSGQVVVPPSLIVTGGAHPNAIVVPAVNIAPDKAGTERQAAEPQKPEDPGQQ